MRNVLKNHEGRIDELGAALLTILGIVGVGLLALVIWLVFTGRSEGPSVPATQPQAPTDVTHIDPLPPPSLTARYAGTPKPLQCVPNDRPHIHVYLATPPITAGVTVAQVRDALLNANGTVNESAAPLGASLRVLCDGTGQLLVTPLPVPDGSWNTVINAAAALGGDQADTRRFIMVNTTTPDWYAGLGQIGTIDSGTYYAAVWQWPVGDLILHEIAHSLSCCQGTVHAPGAPHATGAGHTRDQLDVMTYADGGPLGPPIYPIACRTGAVFDCNHDDYAAVTPTPGSWLAQHPQFNLLSCGDEFIQINACNAPPPVTTTTTTTTIPPPTSTSTSTTTTTVPPPTTSTTTTVPPPTGLAAPGNLRVSAQTCTTIGLAWSTVPGATAYVVQRRTPGSTVWAYLGRTPFARWNANWSANGTYTYRVAAADGAGVPQGPYSTTTATRAC